MSRKKKRNALVTTAGLTILLFSFIVFLLYLIYCFAYYDKYQEQLYVDNFNNGKYDFVYDNLDNKDILGKDKFIKSINSLKDKDRLVNIYNLYYKDRDLYTEEEFVEKYLFNSVKTNELDIEFSSEGKTSLFSRRELLYKNIKITNGSINTAIGLIKNVHFSVESNSSLKVDGIDVNCFNKICTVSNMYGGLHEINYTSNGFVYYGLINVYNDNQSIDITNLDNLIKIDVAEVKISYGKYLIGSCRLEDINICPSMSKSYLMLHEDGSYVTYTYYVSKSDGDIDSGEYYIEDGYLKLESSKGIISYKIENDLLVGDNTYLNYKYVS